MKRFAGLLWLLLLVGGTTSATEVPMGDFFKDPEFTSVTLSPSGKYMSVSVPRGDRTVLAMFNVADMSLLNVWDYGARNHIDRVLWVNDERFFMYVTKKVGRFDARVGTADVYASNVDGTQRTDIVHGGYYQVVDTTPEDPDNILVARSIESAYLFKMDVDDGRTVKVATAPLRYGTFLVDRKGNLRYAMGQDDDNNQITLRRQGDDWVEVHRAPLGGDVRWPLGFAADQKHVYVRISHEGAPSRIVLLDPETGHERELSGNPNVDPDDVLWNSAGTDLVAVHYTDGLPTYDFVGEGPEAAVYKGLLQAFPSKAVNFSGISDDGRYVLFGVYEATDPGSYYLFDRSTGQAKFLLAAMDWIDPEQMSPMKPITLTARDGTPLHGYITIPRFSDGKDLPLILHPHGGPHGPRDSWRFNPEVQFLANRGYAVLQINFRGSGGYGSAFEKAGYRNWGTTMIDDMTDAVDWAIAEGIADEDRICTYGASYGGYAALQTVVREPAKYQCTIGYVGVYSLPLMFEDGDIPERESGRNYLERVMPETLAEQQRQSPAFNIDRINIPVMLVQGAKDVRVPISHYDLLKERLAAAGKPPEVTVVEEKEGHGFYDYQNQIELYTTMEAFLDRHIGDGSTP